MKLERSIERWAALSPKAIASGSIAQSMFCIEDAQKDIATLARALEHSNQWVEAALGCKNWSWDADQREAAEMSVAQSKAVLA